ncbi:MAG: glycosyltransferase [Elusimicrobia bacterium]|nr:glycosyltransferase [Elusimicrobiota bacterium]
MSDPTRGGVPGLSVVLPALDEAAGLATLLPRLEALLARLGVAGEILIIDGGSRDATAAVAAAGGARVLRQQGRGFGAAVREGIAAASAPWILLMDADGSHPPESADALWARRGDAELVIGSRWAPGGSADLGWARRLLSLALNRTARRVLELPAADSSSGFRLYRAEAAKAAAAASSAADLSVQQELLVRVLAAGGRVVEEPFRYEARVGGVSKSSALRLLPSYLRMLVRLKTLRGGWRAEAGLGAVLALGLAAGLCGIAGGVPGPGRWAALPESLRGSPEFARALADSWARLYAEIRRSHAEMRADEPRTAVAGVVEVAPGWTFPPDPLVNASRALLTQSVSPDEKKSFIILSRMRPWRLDFEPLYAQYGGAFVYPLGAALAAAHVLGFVSLTPDLAYYLARPEAMGRLYLAGRVYVLFFHLGTLFLLFELGRSLSGRGTAFAAALLWALAPVAAANVHVLKPHPVAAFWFAAAACAMVRAVRGGRGEDYALCGFCAGLAAGSSLAVGFGLGLPPLGRLLGGRGSWRAAAGGSVLGLAVLAATNPYLVLAPRNFAWELTVYAPSRFAPSLAAARALAAGALPEGLGVGLALLAGWGLLSALFRDAGRRALALTVLAGGLLVLARFPEPDLGAMRLYYPLAALAVVLAADALAAAPRTVALALFTAVLVETSARGAVYLADLAAEAGPAATRLAAGRWIEENVPPGASLGLLRYPEPAHTPLFRWDRRRLVVFESARALDGRVPPDWIAAPARGWEGVDPGLRMRYDVAREFPSARLFGRAARDGSFFANATMLVLRRRP